VVDCNSSVIRAYLWLIEIVLIVAVLLSSLIGYKEHLSVDNYYWYTLTTTEVFQWRIHHLLSPPSNSPVTLSTQPHSHLILFPAIYNVLSCVLLLVLWMKTKFQTNGTPLVAATFFCWWQMFNVCSVVVCSFTMYNV